MKLGSHLLRRLSNPAATLVLVDALALFVAYYLATAIRFRGDFDVSQWSVGDPLPRAVTYTIWLMIGLLSMGLYRSRQRPTRAETFVRVVLGVAVGGIGLIIFLYLFPSLTFGRGVMFLALMLGGTMLVGVRLGMLPVLDAHPMKRRVLVIGAGQAAAKLRLLRRRSDRRRFDVVAFVATSDVERQHAEASGIDQCVLPEDARKFAPIDEIVVAVDDRRGSLPMDFLLDQKQRGVMVTDIVDFLERETERLDLDLMRPSWLLYERSSQTRLIYGTLKRVLDLVAGVVFLTMLMPVFALVVVSMWCEDGFRAPIFYRQQRVGKNGRVFALLKFRSMRVDAESQTGPRFASDNDDRVTRVGRVLRRFRIDELPQLINIISGDMSVVGPRPERPEFVDTLTQQVPLYFYRHGVRPGLTGWAQLNFPYGASFDDAREKLQYDLYYIKNTNVVMDLLILAQTLEVVAWGRGTAMSGGSREARQGGSSEPVPPITIAPVESSKDAA